jgi:hypothetical protein
VLGSITALCDFDYKQAADFPRLGGCEVTRRTLEGDVPLNVLRICKWTLMCTRRPSGPDIHPSVAGDGVIAQTSAHLS